MLNPHNDRLDYGEMLSPPSGFELEFAIGTTYSLDLDALVGVCLSLGLSSGTDSALGENPIYLLEALRKTCDRVALFCEGGQIHMPRKSTSLYILLEKMVFSVNTVKRRGFTAYPSFHPKIWLIKYIESNGRPLYRIVVLSRNLTFDRSWDVAYYMDGYPQAKQINKNEPLCDFLRYLIGQIPHNDNGKKKTKQIREIIKELPNVLFEVGDKAFDYEFIPNGIKDLNNNLYRAEQTPLFKETFHEVLIISPFVSNDIIKLFNNRNQKSQIQGSRYMLITRKMSLSRLKPEDADNFEIYIMKDNVIDGETALSSEDDSIQRQDIHAKVYMIRKYSDTNLYIGSLNASHNAVFGNIEFMLCLKTKNRYLNMDSLSRSLFCGEKDDLSNPFERVNILDTITPEANPGLDLDSIIKEINRKKKHALVEKDSDGLYKVSIFFKENKISNDNVTIKPLLFDQEKPLCENVLFNGLSSSQVSEFYVLSVSFGIETIKRVILIQTEGIPDDRENAVISSIVGSRDCFFRYVAFILGDDSVVSGFEVSSDENALLPTRNKMANDPALYEKMLQAATMKPEKFKEIEYMMKAIGEKGIIPTSFRTLYETFQKVIDKNG